MTTMGWDIWSRQQDDGTVLSHEEALRQEWDTPHVVIEWESPGAGMAYAAIPQPDGSILPCVALVEDERSSAWAIELEPESISIKELPPEEVPVWPIKIARLITW